MRQFIAILAAVGLASSVTAASPPAPMVSGLQNPESVAIGTNGKIYVSVIGEFDKLGDGSVVVIENGEAKPFATGLDDPKGLAVHLKWIYVTDRNRVMRIDENGQVDIFAPTNAFPVPPKFLNDVVVDPESGMLYVSDSGDLKGGGGAVFRITPNGLVSLIVDADRLPGLHTPNGLAMDGASHLLLADFGTGNLYRIKLATNTAEKIAEGLGAADGVAWDDHGRLFVSDWKGGRVFVIAHPGAKPELLAEGFGAAADICFQRDGNQILVPDMKNGTLTALPAHVPSAPVDQSALPMELGVAFPQLTWTGWEPEDEKGKLKQHRPIVLTHAGDGSNRLFLAEQQGVIHLFPNDPKATKTKVFLDIRDRVRYDDKTNEEGFLGLAFHPRYKETGEFFVFYTPKKADSRSNVVVRFRVSKDDPDRAEPASEEELIRYENRPYWNHDGGTIAFGPDGLLYIVHGDGGAANDRYDNAQSLSSLFGKILRIDVDKKSDGKPYAIPPDNPFISKEGARPEIYAWGLRNVWRMAFDRKTGQLWAGDVGQNLFEEINLIRKGGNYGWNRREGLHPFGALGVDRNDEMIDPIWEYNHDVGKSITGGAVYRGSERPELAGHYLYADYISGRLWALKYDEAEKRVVANRKLKDTGKAVLSFGEDEKGELYLLCLSPDGKGVFKIVAK